MTTVQLAGGGPNLFALMSDNTLWILNCGIAPLAWIQLPAPPALPALIALIQAYKTPVVTDEFAYVPIVIDASQNLLSYDVASDAWIVQGSDPSMAGAPLSQDPIVS